MRGNFDKMTPGLQEENTIGTLLLKRTGAIRGADQNVEHINCTTVSMFHTGRNAEWKMRLRLV